MSEDAQFNNENVPTDCPGVESDLAGKESSCQGCPNQNICASGEAQQEKTALLNSVKVKFQDVKKIIIVMSGKGGVGKSTVAMLIARSMAHYTNHEIGYLDIDLCGPSTSRLFGITGEVHRSNFGLGPLVTIDGINVISTDFLLNSKTEALIWRGPKKNSLIKELVLNVNWEGTDYLIIDTPPGTSDEHLSLVELFKLCPQVYALVITTSQEVALIDVRKQINFIKKARIKLLGIVENMSSFICPKCQFVSQVLPVSCNLFGDADYKPLCRLPLDPQISYCESNGLNPFEEIKEENHPVLSSIKDLMDTYLIE